MLKELIRTNKCSLIEENLLRTDPATAFQHAITKQLPSSYENKVEQNPNPIERNHTSRRNTEKNFQRSRTVLRKSLRNCAPQNSFPQNPYQGEPAG